MFSLLRRILRPILDTFSSSTDIALRKVLIERPVKVEASLKEKHILFSKIAADGEVLLFSKACKGFGIYLAISSSILGLTFGFMASPEKLRKFY